ncbi:unnamed protein product [Allacma fusca]|uniref:SCP domain-containing protein n=1 Tax=Allacma fusca TaxID=39272 RepID=A0A8J2PJN8_9HEXA|nr:unnamed protein product [Allacma fusca]
MKILFILCSLVVLSGAQYGLNKDMLAQHNNARVKHQVGVLSIGNPLVANATECAKYYAKNNKIDHSCSGNKGYGENLAWYMSSNGPPKQQDAANKAFSGWYNEVEFYDYNTGKTKVQGKAIGHFTQVVWKSSQQVGCGTAENAGEKKTFTCCLYSPPGNYEGEYTKNVFPIK